ncbi:MAG: peptidoglycan D,D-transpeptidase FtsI family protein, partial [bacterium]
MVKNIAEVSRRISKVLKIPTADLLANIRKSKLFVLAARQISLEDAEKIRAMDLEGVKLIESPQRVYPLNEQLAQVLGFVGTDGKGLSGLELQFDDFLKGQDGLRIVQKDATGKKILAVDSSPDDQQNGNDLILTIDSMIQAIAEEELKAAVSKYNAKGGTVIITRPHTGEILAMASQPGFNANSPGTTTADRWRNRAITDIYEPGSTFKVVTMMAALSQGLKNLDDIIFCENGKYQVFGETINDPESHGWLSFRNVFKYSSNIGTAKIALELGKENLFKAARNLGFGNRSGIELPGEVPGILRKPTEWSRFSLAAISYGHEIAVTPLQMAMAYGAIANGGLLMKPAIVKSIKSKSKESIYEFRPESIRRVMTSSVAQTITDVLQAVVTEGTGDLARIPNGPVAGKTGTAQKLNSNHNGYSNSKFIASFAGFYPAEHPDYLIFLCIDEPFPTHSGGKVAAPTFRKILERILSVYQEAPIRNRKGVKRLTTSTTKMIPNLNGRRLETVKKILRNLGIKYTTKGSGDIVITQQTEINKDSGEIKKITL